MDVVADPPTEKPDAASARAQALIGRTLSDRYRIVALVAMGGMGAVYKAEHLLMHKHVAVKVLHPDVEGFPELVARFEREAVAGAHVQHPNVAIASDFGKFDGGSAFLVLEYIEGITLRDLMDLGPIPPRRAASIVRQVAAALSAVHQKGIVHRDVKPRNIMIGRRGGSTPTLPPVESDAEDVVKLIDFGLAKVPVEGLSAIAKDDNLLRELTEAGVVMGTRFKATNEFVGSPTQKQGIVGSDGSNTLQNEILDIAYGLRWPARVVGRAMTSKFTEEWLGRDEELRDHVAKQPMFAFAQQLSKSPDTEVNWAGESSGLVDEILPAAEVVRRTVDDAERHLRDVARLLDAGAATAERQ